MRIARHLALAQTIALVIGAAFAGEAAAQTAVCANDAPDPYAADVSFAVLPDGRICARQPRGYPPPNGQGRPGWC